MSAATSSTGPLAFDEGRGEWRDGEARYVMIRHDSLMGLFRRLPATARGEALVAFAESVAEHGGRSAERYRMSATETEALLLVVGDTARRLGWGRWRFERTAEHELRLDVWNSPFAAGYGPAQEPICAAIAGMLRALASLVFGMPAVAEEISCAAAQCECCRFVARPRYSKKEQRP